MTTPLLGLLSIFAAIALGTLGAVNIGLLAIVFAFAVGQGLVGMAPGEIVAGWPLGLFFMLVGMTLLFGIARVNGTLELLSERMMAPARGRARLVPFLFFAMAGLLAAVGAGNIVVCAVFLPIAMAAGRERDIPPLLTATMVIAGSNAGGLSPLAPTGIIANTLSGELGFDIAGSIFLRQILGQSILALLLFMALGGWRLASDTGREPTSAPAPFDRAQRWTLTVLLLVVFCIVGLRWDIGLTAFSGAVALLALRAASEKEVLAAVPWATILLVCGVTVLVKVADQAGSIDLLAQQLTRLMSERSAAPVMALIAGTLSLVSSASGVVLPTLIPTVPGIVAETGGDPARIISAIVMGAHMVTNSPISTLGALAVASVGFGTDRHRLFLSLFGVGVAGLLYAALIVYLGIV